MHNQLALRLSAIPDDGSQDDIGDPQQEGDEAPRTPQPQPRAAWLLALIQQAQEEAREIIKRAAQRGKADDHEQR